MKKGGKSGAPKTSLRPRARPVDVSPKAERGDIELMLMEEKERLNKKMGGGKMHRMPDGSMMAGASHGMNYGGKMKKMKHGGKCRGMGAATRGGNFYKDG